MSRIENPREAIKDGSTGIFCLSITCQYGLLTVHSLCSRTQLGLKTLIKEARVKLTLTSLLSDRFLP